MPRKNPMLSKRWLINLALVLLIILLAYIGNKYNSQSSDQPANRITDLKAADINSVSIKTDGNTITLSKADGIWRIETPVLWYANNITVERIINIVNAQTDSKLPVSEIDPATLGLQSPKATLVLNNTQIAFGATNNIGERRYVQIDDTVYLLKDRYLPFITQGITGLLDRRLLPRALALKSLKLPDTRIDRQGENVWSANSGSLNASEAGEIIENWQTLESVRIDHYRINQPPLQKMTAILEDDDEIVFHVIAIEPQLIIARSDLKFQYHFKERNYHGLLAATNDESTAH